MGVVMVMPEPAVSISVQGGGAVWMNYWKFSVSRFMVMMQLGENGINVQFPSDPVSLKSIQFQALGHQISPEDLRWSCEWDQFNYVLAAPGSMLIVRTDGSRCRFKSIRHKRLREIRSHLITRHVAVSRVRTTLFHYLKADMK